MTTSATAEAQRVTIVCATDEGYAMPLCACLASAITFLDARASLHVHVLDAGIRPDTRSKFSRSLEALANDRLQITFVDISGAPEIRDYAASGHINWVTLSKLLIPRLLPAVDKAIWLDCDLVVCDDLLALWRLPMGATSMLAVQESTVGRTLPFAPQYGVALDAPYFNAGVIVLDLAALRRNDFTRRALAFLARHPNLTYLDQDVFNIVGAHDWTALDPRWNFIVAAEPDTLEAVARAHQRAHPAIVHYASVPKPWHWGYGYQRLYSSYFYYALNLTEWRGWQPPVRLRQVVRAHFPAAFATLKALRRELSRKR